jgi:hypothetical protein
VRLVQAGLAAVGAFWSELIPTPSPTPSLWDYEGAALADREAEVDVWEPSHADYDDEPRYTLKELFDIRTDKWNQDDERPGRGNGNDAGDGAELSSGAPVASMGAGVWNLPRDPAPSVAVTVPAVAAFTFNAGELVSTARELIYNHYRHNGMFLDGAAFLAAGAAELVVSQLVADLTAAYTAAQK